MQIVPSGPVTDPILVRRPAFPRWWDPIARPHDRGVMEIQMEESFLMWLT
ncbi:MAG: hypothetical protein ACW985_12670 [Candidatus Thorarchaeota archaeon]